MIIWQKHNGSNPAKLIKLKREPNARARYFLQDEIKLIENNIQGDLYPYFIGGIHLGMRMSELCQLTWQDVSFEQRQVYVAKSKSGKPRYIPISKALFVFLEKLHENKKSIADHVFGTLSEGYISHRFSKTLKTLGIKKACFHSTRHTFASYLVMAGVNIYRVSKWLGHASVTTTEKYYANLAPDFQKEEISKLDRLTGLSPVTENRQEPSNSQDSTVESSETVADGK